MPAADRRDLHARATRGRDAVIHFDDKLAMSENVQLEVDAIGGVTVTSPPSRKGGDDEVSHIAWMEMASAARALLSWLDVIEKGH